jgi:hypothetical protein
MITLRLTFACGPYDRTQSLRDGTRAPEASAAVCAIILTLEI